MNLLEALKQVSKGHRITCPNWKANGIHNRPSYIFKTEGSKELGYYCGLKDAFEPVEVSIQLS